MPPRRHDLASAAFAFVVQWGGAWPERALGNFRKFLDYQGILPDDATLDAAIADAVARYQDGDAAVFRCTGSACVEHAGDAALEADLGALAERLRAAVVETDCLGACSKAPTVVVRLGRQAVKVSEMDDPRRRAALAAFVEDVLATGARD